MLNKAKKICVLLLLCVFAGAGSIALAASWPQLEERLESWDGMKEVQLPHGIDPIDDPVFAPVVQMLLEKGFAVQVDAGADTTRGLVLRQRRTPTGAKLVLSRARDGALLALADVAKTQTSSSALHGKESEVQALAPAQASPAEKPQPRILSNAAHMPKRMPSQKLRINTDSEGTLMSVTGQTLMADPAGMVLDMPGRPVSIATWSLPGSTEFHLFALYDTCLRHFCYQGRRLRLIDEFSPSIKVSRALRLECADLDADGAPELAPVWVEDIHSVDEGTDSRVHAWVVGVDQAGMLEEKSPDLEGYLALVDGRLCLQRRGEFTTFSEAVYAVEPAGERYRMSSAPVFSTKHWLFNHARWPDNERVLIWNDDQRLVLAARSGMEHMSDISATGTLLSDFGTYQGSIIYIPLEEPEYRSGFSAHDRVMAREEHVPRRMLPHGDALFTLASGRDPGLPLVGSPSGRDKLIQITHAENALQAHFPFAPVEAFILDFALLDRSGEQMRAALLLNEKPDGSGKAYLQLQGIAGQN